MVLLVSTSSIKHELHKRGSAALAYLSHQAVVDMDTIFSHDSELRRTVQAVNIAVQASNIVQRANVAIQWQETRLRDWVLILEYGSQETSTTFTPTISINNTAYQDTNNQSNPDTNNQNAADQNAVKQSYWAALLATSVLVTFASRCRPKHVDILHELANSEILALEFLHTQSLGRTYLDHRNVASLTTSRTTSGVSPKTLCEHVLLPAEACKQRLRHLYTLNLIKGVSDGTSMSMRQLYLTELGFELMSRLHFGVLKLA